MGKVTRRRVENTIRNKKVVPTGYEITYEGRGSVVRCDNLDQVNWSKVKSVTVFDNRTQMIYVGYYEGDGNYSNAGPILKPQDRITIK